MACLALSLQPINGPDILLQTRECFPPFCALAALASFRLTCLSFSSHRHRHRHRRHHLLHHLYHHHQHSHDHDADKPALISVAPMPGWSSTPRRRSAGEHHHALQHVLRAPAADLGGRGRVRRRPGAHRNGRNRGGGAGDAAAAGGSGAGGRRLERPLRRQQRAHQSGVAGGELQEDQGSVGSLGGVDGAGGAERHAPAAASSHPVDFHRSRRLRRRVRRDRVQQRGGDAEGGVRGLRRRVRRWPGRVGVYGADESPPPVRAGWLGRTANGGRKSFFFPCRRRPA
ncbi:hypothetical protein ACLOJK_040560 [Asimina triloba]